MSSSELLARLSPITLGLPLPVSSNDFLVQAASYVSERVLSDLTLLAAYKDIDRALNRALKENQEEISCAEFLFLDQRAIKSNTIVLSLVWPWYWGSVKSLCHAKVLRRIAEEMATFFQAIASKRETNEISSHALVEACFKHSDPVLREHALLKAQVEIAVSKASRDARTDDHIFVYYLKLVVGERMLSFDETLGRLQLDLLVEKIIQGAHE